MPSVSSLIHGVAYTAVGLFVIIRLGVGRELVTGIKVAKADPANPTAPRSMYM